MPGIAGFTVGDKKTVDARNALADMRELMIHKDWYVCDPLFVDGSVCATRCHTDVLQKAEQPFTVEGVSVWMDGEFYNREDVATQHGVVVGTDPQLLHALYRRNSDLSLLKDIDGVFAAVIWDSNRRRLHLVTDRYGFRQLYWTAQGDRLAWASEVKAMLGVPRFEPRIDLKALGHFLGVGHFIHDRTWFEGVRQLTPATVLSWDMDRRSVQMHRYWWWDEIQPWTGRYDENLIADELGTLYREGVRRRMPPGDRVGVELGGGRDSRGILAAMPERGEPIHAVTVGNRGCNEVRVAAEAARVKPNVIHHVFDIDEQNWLMPRLEAVWQTDGCLNIRHMHNICLRGQVKQYYDVYFHGAGGGIVGGGSQFPATREAFLGHMLKKYRGMPHLLTPDFLRANEQDLLDYFDWLGSSHALYADWMVRSFTIHYVRTNRVDGVECRVPIFDNRFQERLFSLPLDKRRERGLDKHDRLYKKMLLRTFPAYYRTIPYQNIGIPISWPDPAGCVSDTVRFARRVRNKVLKETAALVGMKFSRKSWYHDYANWIPREPARTFLSQLLTSPSALYSEYIEPQQVHDAWQRHLQGADESERLCRYLTLELWLRQVFEGQYRGGDAEEANQGPAAQLVAGGGAS